MLRSKRMLTAITRQQSAFAVNKVAHIVALGLLYALIPLTQFKQMDGFLRAGHIYLVHIMLM